MNLVQMWDHWTSSQPKGREHSVTVPSICLPAAAVSKGRFPCAHACVWGFHWFDQISLLYPVSSSHRKQNSEPLNVSESHCPVPVKCWTRAESISWGNVTHQAYDRLHCQVHSVKPVSHFRRYPLAKASFSYRRSHCLTEPLLLCESVASADPMPG